MRRLKHIALVLALSWCGHAVWAADDAGVVKISKGSVAIERSGQKLDAPVGTRILTSDRLTTGADGSVGVTLRDNGERDRPFLPDRAAAWMRRDAGRPQENAGFVCAKIIGLSLWPGDPPSVGLHGKCIGRKVNRRTAFQKLDGLHRPAVMLKRIELGICIGENRLERFQA